VTEDTRRTISNLKIDARLMRALAHPVRVQIVAELSKPGRVISPSEFAEQFINESARIIEWAAAHPRSVLPTA
jgi:hypothetical protein